VLINHKCRVYSELRYSVMKDLLSKTRLDHTFLPRSSSPLASDDTIDIYYNRRSITINTNPKLHCHYCSHKAWIHWPLLVKVFTNISLEHYKIRSWPSQTLNLNMISTILLVTATLCLLLLNGVVNGAASGPLLGGRYQPTTDVSK